MWADARAGKWVAWTAALWVFLPAALRVGLRVASSD